MQSHAIRFLFDAICITHKLTEPPERIASGRVGTQWCEASSPRRHIVTAYRLRSNALLSRTSWEIAIHSGREQNVHWWISANTPCINSASLLKYLESSRINGKSLSNSFEHVCNTRIRSESKQPPLSTYVEMQPAAAESNEVMHIPSISTPARSSGNGRLQNSPH
jgi:hypothetical protein